MIGVIIWFMMIIIIALQIMGMGCDTENRLRILQLPICTSAAVEEFIGLMQNISFCFCIMILVAQ